MNSLWYTLVIANGTPPRGLVEAISMPNLWHNNYINEMASFHSKTLFLALKQGYPDLISNFPPVKPPERLYGITTMIGGKYRGMQEINL
jgi:hypothetical protein